MLNSIALIFIFLVSVSFSMSQTTVRQVDCGNEASYLLIDNQIYATGSNSNNVLLVEGSQGLARFTRIDSNATWRILAAGSQHCMAIKNDGTLWSWGANKWGQLGNGTFDDINAPIKISSRTDWDTVVCGYAVSYAITSSGELFGCGWNIFRQISADTVAQVNSLGRIDSSRQWKSISVNGFHTLAVDVDSGLYGWGLNIEKQITDVSEEVIDNPRLITKIPIASFSAGFLHSMCILNDGSLWTWGSNMYSQLGTDQETTSSDGRYCIMPGVRWMQCEAGPTYSFGISTDGRLFGWGLNREGQTGTGSSEEIVLTPTEVKHTCKWSSIAACVGQIYGELLFGFHSIAVDENGLVFGAGSNYMGQIALDVERSLDFKQSIVNRDNISVAGRNKVLKPDNLAISTEDNCVRISHIPECESSAVILYDIHGEAQASGECESDHILKLDIEDIEAKRYFIKYSNPDGTIERVYVDIK